MIGDRRDRQRDHSFARILVIIEGRLGYIADVSDNGFKGLFPEPFEAEIGKSCNVYVSFEELGLSTFEIRATIRWSRISSGALEVGFELGESEKSEKDAWKFLKIRDYYANDHLRST